MKALRFLGKFLLVLILLALILWAMILGMLQTKPGQEWTFKQVISFLEDKTQKRIEIKKIAFAFPLNLNLEHIAILQDGRPILTIQNLELSCDYPRLLQGRIVLSKLQADHINILEAPAESEPSLKEDPLPWETIRLPFYFKIENLDIQDIRLSRRAIDSLNLPQEVSSFLKHASIDLNGIVTNPPFRSALEAHLLMTAKSDLNHLTPFNIRLDTQNHQLSFSLNFNQLPLQLLQPDFPSGLQANLALHASAPVSTWQNLVQNPSQEMSPIEGHFKCILTSSTPDSSAFSALIDQQTVIRSHYFLKSKRAIELVNLKIENPHFFLIGGTLLTGEGIIDHGHFQGGIHDLEHFRSLFGKEIEMQGEVDFDLYASGSLFSPSLVLHLNSPRLSIAQQTVQNIHSTIQTDPKSQNSSGFLTLSLDYQGIPWKAATSFNWNDQKQLTLSHLQIDAMHSHLQGEMRCFFPEGIWEGSLETHVGNFDDLSHFLSSPIKGDGQCKIQFVAVKDSDHQKKQGIQAELIGNALRWRDGQAQHLTLHAHVDPLKQKSDFFQIEAWFDGKQMKWKDYVVEQGHGHLIHTIDVTSYNIQHLSTEWLAQNIQWPEGKAKEAKGQAHLRTPLQVMEGDVEFVARQVQTPALQIEELKGSTTVHPNQLQWPFHLQGKGNWKGELLFSLDGNWHYQQDTLKIEATQLSGQFGPYPLQLKQPAQFTQHDAQIKLAGLWLQWGEAELQGDFDQNQEKISSRFKTNPIPSELFHLVASDLPLKGKATFQGHVEGTIHQPKGQFQIDLHQIQITEDIFAKKPFISGRLLLNLDEKGIQLTSNLNGIGNTPLLVSGHFPLIVNLNPISFKMDAQRPFELLLNAEGELDPYLHLFYNDVANLSGQSKIALKLSGQIDHPQIQGHIDFVNGAYESLSTGALYHNIQAHLEGDGSKIILTKMFAQDSKNGQISATGTVNLDAKQHFPFEFQIHPSRIFILDSDSVDISASGRLTLIGNTKHSKIQGELTVDQVSVDLEETLPRQIKRIDIKYVNIPQGQSLPNYVEKQETSSNLELDVKLNAPQNVTIQGKHLKSQWKGDLTITGTPENPQLHGDLRIVQGQYHFNDKTFNLSQGNIHFAGAPDKKTTLYIVASKEIDRITAEIIVKGPANKPVISFRSNPPLPQRGVLSYILFNRGISDITPDQGEQLSQSFISLNTSDQTKSSDNFLSRLRNNIGLDHLDFTSNNDPNNKDFGLQVGKHITEDIMVSAKESTTSVYPIVAIEAKLHKNIKVEAQRGFTDNTPVQMSIKWKKDY